MTSIQTLKHIGPYLEFRFRTESYWPPNTNNRRPIRTLEELEDFVRTRRGPNRKSKLRGWFIRILQNERSNTCVGRPKWVEGELRQYNVRDVNELGWNAVMNFLRSVIPLGHDVRNDIPPVKRHRPASGYPRKCVIYEFI